MYLKTLYIQGFKSFANKTKIDFNNKITGVVGPNGSGKSNISDAIMWVLGETSIKSLRGNKMEDVIFSGTDHKKPLGFAEVTIVFDNSDKTLPLEYNEISVTRRMYRSLESEFLINNVKCRLKDIKELFMDTGIGKDGYSLIGQGKIESVLSAKSENRRAIFEEAAGISKFKMRKSESERKLEKTRDNLLRLNDIIIEIEKREILLKEQSEEAILYKEKFDKLKYLDITLTYLDIESKKENLLKLNKDISILKNNLETFENNVKNNKNKQEKDNIEIEILEEKLNELQEEELQKNRELEKRESEISLLKERLLNSRKEIDFNKNSILEVISENNFYIEEKKEKELFLENIKEEILNFEKEKNLLEEFLKNKNLEFETLENSQKDNSENNLNMHKIINEISLKIQMKETMLKEKKDKVEIVDRNLNMLTENNLELIQSLDKLSEEYNFNKDSIQSIFDEKTIIEKHLENEKKSLEDISKDLYESKSKFEEYSTKYKILKNISDNYDGYSKSVKEFMNITQKQNLFKDSLIGTVAEMITVDKKVQKAISVALGGSIQNIIISEEKSAKDMISFLNKNKIGRITFLPLNTISFNNRNKPDLSGYENILGYADKLIDYDEKYDNIFKNLLGRIIVAKDFKSGSEISSKLNKSYRVVTLEGDSFNIGGSLTGGAVYKGNISIIGRENELKDLEDAIIDIKEVYNSLLKKQVEKSHDVEKLNFKYAELLNSIDTNSKKTLELENKINSLKSSKNNNQEYLDKYKLEKNNLLSSIEEDYNSIEKLIVENDKLTLNKNDLDEKINISNKEYEVLKESLVELREEVSNKKIEYANLLSRKNLIIKDLENIELSISKNTEKRRELDLVVENLKKNLNYLEKSIEDLEIIKKDEELDLEKFKEIYDKTKENKKDLSEKLTLSRQEQESINVEIINIEKKLNEKINKIEKNEYQIENIKTNIKNEYSIIDEDIKIHNEIESVTKSKEYRDELKKEIDLIGEVNLLAINEYEEIRERLEFNLTQKDDLIESISEIKNILHKLDLEMNILFKEAFSKVSIYFDEIFKELFNGGKAEIILDGDLLTGGIEIKAQPPGKRLQSLSLLSGGERSLTAVALLFALLKVRPAPFCILDEIDAALDDANIKRYTDYLTSLDGIQFIMITHRKPTMEITNKLYGVTMEEKGISKLVSVELNN